jgi:hypothetical protein
MHSSCPHPPGMAKRSHVCGVRPPGQVVTGEWSNHQCLGETAAPWQGWDPQACAGWLFCELPYGCHACAIDLQRVSLLEPTAGAKVFKEVLCSVGRYSRLELLYILGVTPCSLSRAGRDMADQVVQQDSSNSNSKHAAASPTCCVGQGYVGQSFPAICTPGDILPGKGAWGVCLWLRAQACRCPRHVLQMCACSRCRCYGWLESSSGAGAVTLWCWLPGCPIRSGALGHGLALGGACTEWQSHGPDVCVWRQRLLLMICICSGSMLVHLAAHVAGCWGGTSKKRSQTKAGAWQLASWQARKPVIRHLAGVSVGVQTPWMPKQPVGGVAGHWHELVSNVVGVGVAVVSPSWSMYRECVPWLTR